MAPVAAGLGATQGRGMVCCNYQKKSYSGSFDAEKGQKPWQKREPVPSAASLAASRRKPHSRDDRAVQLLLTHIQPQSSLVH